MLGGSAVRKAVMGKSQILGEPARARQVENVDAYRGVIHRRGIRAG